MKNKAARVFAAVISALLALVMLASLVLPFL